MHDPLVHLNGTLLPLSQATVSVLDRGFIFGDGIYEVVPIYARKPFRSVQHLARLFRSLDAIGIPNPHDADTWMRLIGEVVAAHPSEDQMAYIQVTRGVARRGHAFPAEVRPTVFIMTNPIVLPSHEARTNGVACVTMEDKRWLRCEIKSTSLLGNVLAAQHAAERGAVESIQLREGMVTEASASNVWIVKDGTVTGPPRDNLILEGIRYAFIEELCAALGLPFEMRRVPRDELFAADEVFLSSATKEVLAVTAIDGQPVGAGKPGPVYQRLYAAYQDAKAQ